MPRYPLNFRARDKRSKVLKDRIISNNVLGIDVINKIECRESSSYRDYRDSSYILRISN